MNPTDPTSAHPTRDLATLEERLAGLRESAAKLRSTVAQSFLGHAEVLEQLLLGILAGGHLLLEGAPGLGKTVLVRATAGALQLVFSRIQFTPDLMPADILGSRILEQDEGGGRRFAFHRGPIFAHVVLADEINRATPRTQSALLEAMAEGQVTVHGETLPLEPPFCVIATQNPIEMEGTYPLPEAQLDRFLARIELGAPDEDELVRILEATTGVTAPPPEACLSRAEVLELRELVREVPASSSVLRLVARLIQRTQPGAEGSPGELASALRYGASPRGGQAVLLMSKARALLRGRLHVATEDVEAVAAVALRHRLIFSYEGEAAGVHPDELVGAALAAALKD